MVLIYWLFRPFTAEQSERPLILRQLHIQFHILSLKPLPIGGDFGEAGFELSNTLANCLHGFKFISIHITSPLL